MNVFIIYKEDYPWDVRVEKLAVSLSEVGHNVTIIARNADQKTRHEQYGRYKIQRLPKTNLLPGFFQKFINLPLWFNPVWLYQIYKSAKASPDSLIIVRDLPLVRTALIVGKLLKVKVIFDMAEVYPEMYASSEQFSRRGLLTKLYKNPAIASRYENAVLPKVDQTLVMIEESRDRLLQKGIPDSKVTIVSNTPPTDKFKGSVKNHEGRTLYLVYVGFLTKLRGLDLLIAAAKKFIDSENDDNCIFIDIVGKGAIANELKALIEELGVEKNVKLHGWLDQSEVDRLMARANVGSLTYRVCGHWNHTIPNKIFDYMLAGLPVLTTPVVPIKRIVNSTQCGLVAEEATPEAIAAKLKALQDPAIRTAYGQNGHSAVLARYNWEQDEMRLLKACSDLM